MSRCGDIPYRFRQKNGANWQHTKQGIVNYLDLSPGNYLFEVQSQNQDGIWSASEILQFSIKSPWYQYWYVRLAGTSLLIAVIVLFKTGFLNSYSGLPIFEFD